jgi:8-hydroxy-5-deazaflavin:NADPH oxidoreductase
VILCNSRGPKSLKEKVELLGNRASAGTVLEAAQQEIVILAAPWVKITETESGLPHWSNRIVIDTTNQFLSVIPEMKIANVEPLTSSEAVAKAYINRSILCYEIVRNPI